MVYSDNAGILGITVASDKTLIGEGSAGIIKGRGLRIVSGAENIIIQYVMGFSWPIKFVLLIIKSETLLSPTSTRSTSGVVTPSPSTRLI